MNHSPKLKQAIAQIYAILDEHDIAGVIVLHTPDDTESIVKLNPSYTCVEQEGQEVRINSNPTKYNGDKEAAQLALANTSNMFSLMAVALSPIAMAVIGLSEVVDTKTKAEHSTTEFTPNPKHN